MKQNKDYPAKFIKSSKMLLMLEDTAFGQYRPRLKRWGNTCTAVAATVIFLLLIMVLFIFTLDMNKKVYVVYFDGSKPIATTSEKFLSISLDTSLIASNFKHFDMTKPRVIKLLKALSPAYLRIGGTMADRLIFTESGSDHYKHNPNGEFDGGDCSYETEFCDYLQKPNFTMNAQEWLALNELAKKANLTLIFDLNSLRRFRDGSWDYRNAESLISFSAENDLELNWELGNEPNAYRRQFNYEVSPSQLASDFQTLHHILSQYPKYVNSLLLGPDVTRPELDRNDSMSYLSQFLSGGVDDIIDAVTWHQYYFNGATARLVDFLDPDYFDILGWQIMTVKRLVRGSRFEKNRTIWLGETSSAYGGGAPHLSNRYVASFLWLDKLGMAAKFGVDVVIRQSFFQGYYALVNANYHPAPDWWVSVLYKKLVGNNVFNCHMPQSETIRLYCQCAKRDGLYVNTSSVTVFGVNISSRKAKIRFEGVVPMTGPNVGNVTVDAYILTTMDRIDSRFIYLNNVPLMLTNTSDLPILQPKKVLANPYVTMPAFSLAFWVIPAEKPYYC